MGHFTLIIAPHDAGHALLAAFLSARVAAAAQHRDTCEFKKQLAEFARADAAAESNSNPTAHAAAPALDSASSGSADSAWASPAAVVSAAPAGAAAAPVNATTPPERAPIEPAVDYITHSAAAAIAAAGTLRLFTPQTDRPYINIITSAFKWSGRAVSASRTRRHLYSHSFSRPKDGPACFDNALAFDFADQLFDCSDPRRSFIIIESLAAYLEPATPRSAIRRIRAIVDSLAAHAQSSGSGVVAFLSPPASIDLAALVAELHTPSAIFHLHTSSISPPHCPELEPGVSTTLRNDFVSPRYRHRLHVSDFLCLRSCFPRLASPVQLELQPGSIQSRIIEPCNLRQVECLQVLGKPITPDVRACALWLENLLIENGREMLATQVFEALRCSEFSMSTLRRAKAYLKIISYRPPGRAEPGVAAFPWKWVHPHSVQAHKIHARPNSSAAA